MIKFVTLRRTFDLYTANWSFPFRDESTNAELKLDCYQQPYQYKIIKTILEKNSKPLLRI